MAGCATSTSVMPPPWRPAHAGAAAVLGSPKQGAGEHGIHTQVFFVVALAATQVANVVGSVYLKASMAGRLPPHPVVFALYRELLAGVTAFDRWMGVFRWHCHVDVCTGESSCAGG
jgi:hypothetical protein